MTDLSPFPADSFHRKLAGYSERDLRLELGLRWAYGLAHVVNTGTDPYDGSRETTPDRYMRELLTSFLITITITLENELPVAFAKAYAREFYRALQSSQSSFDDAIHELRALSNAFSWGTSHSDG